MKLKKYGKIAILATAAAALAASLINDKKKNSEYKKDNESQDS